MIGGGEGGPKDFVWSEILILREFLVICKLYQDFFGATQIGWDFLGYCYLEQCLA